MKRVYKLIVVMIVTLALVGIVQADSQISCNAMTSNASNGCTANRSSIYDSPYEAYHAFDGSTASGNGWLSVSGSPTGWLRQYNATPYIVTSYVIWSGSDPTYMPRDWTFLGSNDGTTQTVIDTITGNTSWGAPGTYKVFPVSNTNAYKYYNLSITANNGAIAVLVPELYIYGYGAPVASFTTNKTGGTAPLPVLLTDTSTNNPTSWAYGVRNVTGNNTWIGIGTTQNLETTLGVGNWSLRLNATNAVGTTTSTQVTFVNVTGSPPDPVFSFFSMFNAAGTAPHTTYLYDQSTNLTGSETFGWDFGEGNTSAEKDVYFTWNFTGEFVVNHSVSNGITTSYSETNVTVGTPTPPVVAPVASFYGSPTTGNVPLTVFFTDVSSNTPTSWFWEFGDGTNSTLQNPNHTYTRSGFRTVNLTATNTAGSNITVRSKFVKVS